MRKYFFILLTALIPSTAFSESLQDQISAVESADNSQQQAEHTASEKAAAEKKARTTREQAAREKEKKREQDYEDKLRQAQLDDVGLDLEAKKAKVSRTNDYIDQDLKKQAAVTDKIQSEADARRNLADGAKEKMKSEGRAEEKKAKGFWSF